MHLVFRGELQKLPLPIRRASWLSTVGIGSALLWSCVAQAEDLLQSSDASQSTTPRLKTVTVQAAKISPVEAAKSQLSERLS